jgi:formylglycine-generating enzyme required for sulfatase activity
MGADDDLERADLIAGSEHPQNQVTITRPFAVGRYAITRGEFAEFVKQTGFTPQENTLV